jgi:hypothetical protein
VSSTCHAFRGPVESHVVTEASNGSIDTVSRVATWVRPRVGRADCQGRNHGSYAV